ncbi:Fic family protein [Mycobacterium tuberculosis]
MHTDDWTGRQLGIVVHADLVLIHPFTDGNGRTTRLLADLVYATVQNPTELQYDWELDKLRLRRTTSRLRPRPGHCGARRLHRCAAHRDIGRLSC